MKLAEALHNNILQRAYSYIDGGTFDENEWFRTMREFLSASNNELLAWSDDDICEITHDVWESIYKVDGISKTIKEWAEDKKKNTKCQTEMRNSIDKLFEAIESYRSSEFFLQLLKYSAKFKLLSPYNAMLVKAQMPSARYVLTAPKWKELYSRRPKRNARPLVILKKFGPISYVFEIADTEPIPGYIFPISDDDILESLADPYATTGNIDDEVYRTLIKTLPYYGIDLDKFRVAASFGAEIRKTSCKVKIDDIDADGYYVISVNDRTSLSTQFASICHELGHLFCHHLTAPKNGKESWWKLRNLTWEQEEFEAEIVSYIICERYGVGNKSWEYLSKVLGKTGKIPNGISVDRVFKAANEVEKMLNPELDPRTCYVYKNDKIFKKKYDKAYPKSQEEQDE